MELELGLKITKLRDDNVTSAMELTMAKDSAGPIFISRETDSMFILSAHLKGYRTEEIKIDINKDGTKLTLSGEKPVREMLMLRWRIYKQESNMRFKKVFRIPDGIILDGIEANFDEEDSVLTIKVPKSVRGIRGNDVEELNEEGDRRMSEYTGHGEIPKRELANHEKQIEEPMTKKESFRGNKKVDRAAETFPEKHEIESGKQMNKMTEEGMKHSSTGKYPEKEATRNQGIAHTTETQETTKMEKLEPKKAKEERRHPNFELVAKNNTIAEHEGRRLEAAKHEEQVIQQSGTATQSLTPSEEALSENKIPQPEIQPQEPQRKHAYTGEESKRGAEPDKGLEQMKTPTRNHPADDRRNKIKLCGGDERSETGNEVPGNRNGITASQGNIRAGTQKSVEAGKPKGHSEHESRTEKQTSTSSLVFSPCFFAGSAILVGLIMLVYQLIRSP